MAGLLNNLTQNDTANIPFLSKIPIIGYLFKSKAERLERTELMVLVTPRLVQAARSGRGAAAADAAGALPAGARRDAGETQLGPVRCRWQAVRPRADSSGREERGLPC